MAKKKYVPAPGSRGERPSCVLCSRPATQLYHTNPELLDANTVKRWRQPANLRRWPKMAVCDSHIDSHKEMGRYEAEQWVAERMRDRKDRWTGNTDGQNV